VFVLSGSLKAIVTHRDARDLVRRTERRNETKSLDESFAQQRHDGSHYSRILGLCNRSGVIISNDMSSNGSRFFIIENRRESYVHVGVPHSVARRLGRSTQKLRRQFVPPYRPSDQ
jgi:hypothetical protein